MQATERKNVLAVIFAVFSIISILAIFILTEQTPIDTTTESNFFNNILIKLFGNISFAYNPDTNLWFGLDIRYWAHTIEFFFLGLFTAFSSYFFLKPNKIKAGAVALIICCACSIFDQCHKLFVPGRHFDWLDLGMDAIGYITAIVVILIISSIWSQISYRLHAKQQ